CRSTATVRARCANAVGPSSGLAGPTHHPRTLRLLQSIPERHFSIWWEVFRAITYRSCVPATSVVDGFWYLHRYPAKVMAPRPSSTKLLGAGVGSRKVAFQGL